MILLRKQKKIDMILEYKEGGNTILMMDKMLIARVLYKKMHDWFWGNAHYYDLFAQHDKNISMADSYDELSDEDKKLLVAQIDFVIDKEPYREAGLNPFTLRKEKFMMETVKSLIK